MFEPNNCMSIDSGLEAKSYPYPEDLAKVICWFAEDLTNFLAQSML